MSILRLSTLSLALAIAVFALGYNPSFAGKPDGQGNHDHGGGGGGNGDVYDVDIIGADILGGSKDGFPWSRSGGKDSIGGPPHAPNGDSRSGTLSNLIGFFGSLLENPLPFTAAQAMVCFGEGTFGMPGTYDIRGGGLGTGKKGVAQAQFWFDAKTFVEGSDRVVTYQLRYLGVFSGADWLPAAGGLPSVLNMDEWRLTATNEGQDIKAISCIGEGLADVRIDVTNVTP